MKVDSNFQRQINERYFEKAISPFKRKLPILKSNEQLRKTKEILKNKILPRLNLLSNNTPPVIQPFHQKPKSYLKFHEYKGPLQKVEITKIPLESTDKLVAVKNESLSSNDQEQQNRIIPLIIESLPKANNDVLSNLLDENSTSVDWMIIPSPIFIDDNPDFIQFLNQLDTDHHLLFDLLVN